MILISDIFAHFLQVNFLSYFISFYKLFTEVTAKIGRSKYLLGRNSHRAGKERLTS